MIPRHKKSAKSIATTSLTRNDAKKSLGSQAVEIQSQATQFEADSHDEGDSDSERNDDKLLEVDKDQIGSSKIRFRLPTESISGESSRSAIVGQASDETTLHHASFIDSYGTAKMSTNKTKQETSQADKRQSTPRNRWFNESPDFSTRGPHKAAPGSVPAPPPPPPPPQLYTYGRYSVSPVNQIPHYGQRWASSMLNSGSDLTTSGGRDRQLSVEMDFDYKLREGSSGSLANTSASTSSLAAPTTSTLLHSSAASANGRLAAKQQRQRTLFSLSKSPLSNTRRNNNNGNNNNNDANADADENNMATASSFAKSDRRELYPSSSLATTASIASAASSKNKQQVHSQRRATGFSLDQNDHNYNNSILSPSAKTTTTTRTNLGSKIAFNEPAELAIDIRDSSLSPSPSPSPSPSTESVDINNVDSLITTTHVLESTDNDDDVDDNVSDYNNHNPRVNRHTKVAQKQTIRERPNLLFGKNSQRIVSNTGKNDDDDDNSLIGARVKSGSKTRVSQYSIDDSPILDHLSKNQGNYRAKNVGKNVVQSIDNKPKKQWNSLKELTNANKNDISHGNNRLLREQNLKKLQNSSQNLYKKQEHNSKTINLIDHDQNRQDSLESDTSSNTSSVTKKASAKSKLNTQISPSTTSLSSIKNNLKEPFETNYATNCGDELDSQDSQDSLKGDFFALGQRSHSSISSLSRKLPLKLLLNNKDNYLHNHNSSSWSLLSPSLSIPYKKSYQKAFNYKRRARSLVHCLSSSSVFALYSSRYAREKLHLALRLFRNWYHEQLTYHKLSRRMEFNENQFDHWFKQKGSPLQLRALDKFDQIVIWIAGK